MADDQTTPPASKKNDKPEQKMRIASRLPHPVFIRYNGDNICIPSQSVRDNLDPSLLEGDLPAGVQSKIY